MTNTIPTVGLAESRNQYDTQVVVITPVAATYAISMNPSFPFTILGIDCVTNTGTLDIQVTIDGTPVTFTTDGTTVGVSSTVKSRTAASARDVGIGDPVRLVVSNLASTPAQLEVCIHYQRT